MEREKKRIVRTTTKEIEERKEEGLILAQVNPAWPCFPPVQDGSGAIWPDRQRIGNNALSKSVLALGFRA